MTMWGPTALRRIETVHMGLVCALASGLGLLAGASMTASVLLGGTLIWGNVWLLKQLFSAVIKPHPFRRRLAIALLFAKLPLLWGVFWVITRVRLVAIDGIALGAGVAAFPAAVLLVAVCRHPQTQSEHTG